MKRTAIMTWVLITALSFLIPSNGICENSSERIKEGRELHLKILNSHKKIDKSYREPFIHGGLTSNPICCISVPVKDWESLPDSRKQALADYAASLVKKVKADPFKYTGVSANAPAASAVRVNVTKMTDASWGIMVGDVSPDSRDITSDRIVRSGK